MSGIDKNDCSSRSYSQYYTGNKNIPGLIHKIVNEIPVCTSVIELFAGSASLSNFIAQYLGREFTYIINDIDSGVIDTFDYPAGSMVMNKDVFDILQSFETVRTYSGEKPFLFIDPPYLMETRKSRILYKHEFEYVDHELLLIELRNIKYNVMVIHPVCSLYDEGLSNFRKVQLKVRYHNKTSNECLYMNYDKPSELLIFDLLGSNCWDRQRIKRKGERMVQKLMALPNQERNYILNRIKELQILRRV